MSSSPAAESARELARFVRSCLKLGGSVLLVSQFEILRDMPLEVLRVTAGTFPLIHCTCTRVLIALFPLDKHTMIDVILGLIPLAFRQSLYTSLHGAPITRVVHREDHAISSFAPPEKGRYPTARH